MLRTHVSTAGDPNVFGMQRKGFLLLLMFFFFAWLMVLVTI